MDAIERLTLEVKKHRKSIDDYLRDIQHAKNNVYKYTERTKEAEPDENLWGLIYEECDRICNYNKQLKELRRLMLLKMEIIAKEPTSSGR